MPTAIIRCLGPFVNLAFSNEYMQIFSVNLNLLDIVLLCEDFLNLCLLTFLKPLCTSLSPSRYLLCSCPGSGSSFAFLLLTTHNRIIDLFLENYRNRRAAARLPVKHLTLESFVMYIIPVSVKLQLTEAPKHYLIKHKSRNFTCIICPFCFMQSLQ